MYFASLGQDARSFAHTDLGMFLSADPPKLWLDGDCWRTDILRSFQRCLIRVESRVGFRLLGHSRTSTELSISWCLGCVLRITVLLESKLSAQNEVLRALDQVFSKDFALFINPSTLTSLPVAEPPTKMLLEVSPISTRDYWSSTRVTIGFLDLPRSLSFISASYTQNNFKHHKHLKTRRSVFWIRKSLNKIKRKKVIYPSSVTIYTFLNYVLESLF